MGRFWKQAVAILVVAIEASLWCSSPSLAAKPGGGGTTGPSYQIFELDSLNGAFVGTPFDINKDGLIVGGVTGSAACWTVTKNSTTVTTTLYPLGGDVATAVNDSGEIVGSGGGVAAYWVNRLAAPQALPVPAGSTRSQAMSISNDGVICGWSASPDPNNPGQLLETAVAWRVSIVDGNRVISWPRTLPAVAGTDATKARAVNDSDALGVAMVVGEAWNSTTGGGTGLVWEVALGANNTLAVNPVPSVLDADSTATGVNDPGVICGYLYQDAVVWAGDTRRILDRSATVAAFGGRASCTSASAWALNTGGLIAGEGHFSVYRKAVIWPSTTASMILLDKFLTKGVNITELNSANAVNDLGVIVGTGWDSNRKSYLGYVAIPK